MIGRSAGKVGHAAGAQSDPAAGSDGELVSGQGGGFGLDNADFAVKVEFAGGGFARRGFDAQGRSGLAEAAVFEGANAAQDQGKRGGASSASVKSAGGLHHGFQHHDAGEDGKAGEVIEEIFLSIGDMLDGHEMALIVFEDAINQREMHGQ